MSGLASPVEQAFERVPAPVATAWSALRAVILETAANMPEVGPVTESLKWGEPSFSTDRTKSGTPIRLGWKAATPDTVKLLVHCQTSLVPRWRELYGDRLSFEGTRAILLDIRQPLPREELAHCVAMALTYKLNR